MDVFIGIDIGSTSAKTVAVDKKGTILRRLVQPTGWSSVDTAAAIRQQLRKEGIDASHTPCVATGYGRIAVPYADKCITEITCHAKGAGCIFDESDLTVIDIGGQDTKIIQVVDSAVSDFLMNDKCSAGTGRFLEIMANILSVRLDELTELASRGSDTTISSMCTVFAESEVISLIGKGEQKENIAFAVVDSIVKKVSSQAGKLILGNRRVCLTGGLCDSAYICEALSKELGKAVTTHADGRYAGAYGAALLAAAL
ncbi:MAG: acyl-CoA dehydratase activase [Anaerovoracaceae bacterium]|jgi:predicted CoA-substrate-specific enzyme activase|nr:acyl-CoA dehydratase activase [Eubacteriales bacterium]MDD3290471.1 acyl-CoA dehydratase activase [Eubacteriales bacterium]MDD3864303.1 acyl-CoA dehydratase activase [Eubacteriales bacterium]MDD4444845.1 acyl-CoA dehydratase activase [Eubacteriales bacterium]